MRYLHYVVYCAIVLSGCSIASPQTTAETWLRAQQESFQASTIIAHTATISGTQVIPLASTPAEQNQYLDQLTKIYGNILEYEVKVSLPLQQQDLDHYQLTEGVELYLNQNSQRRGKEEVSVWLVKLDDTWYVLDTRQP